MTAPTKFASLGRTIVRWAGQSSAWQHAWVSNGPTETINNLIKRVKRVAFGFRRFAHCRIRALLYAGKPQLGPLATATLPDAPTAFLGGGVTRRWA